MEVETSNTVLHSHSLCPIADWLHRFLFVAGKKGLERSLDAKEDLETVTDIPVLRYVASPGGRET